MLLQSAGSLSLRNQTVSASGGSFTSLFSGQFWRSPRSPFFLCCQAYILETWCLLYWFPSNDTQYPLTIKYPRASFREASILQCFPDSAFIEKGSEQHRRENNALLFHLLSNIVNKIVPSLCKCLLSVSFLPSAFYKTFGSN